MAALFDYPVLLAAVVTLGLFGAVWRYFDNNRLDAERSSALERLGASRGWAYTLKDGAIRKELGLPFGWSSRWERNYMRGREGTTEFIVFDQYTEHKNSPRTRRTYAAFRMGPGFPRFQALPNTLQMRLSRNLFWSNLEFPEDPRFSEIYHVESPEKDMARPHFNDRVRSELARRPGWLLESSHGWLRMTDGATDGEAEAVPAFQAEAWEIAKAFL